MNSDMEFLRELQYGYYYESLTEAHARPSALASTKKSVLKQVAPELSTWFDNHYRSNGVYAHTPLNVPPLAFGMSRAWFSLAMKFYILLSPSFTIMASDTTNNRSYEVVSKRAVYISPDFPPTLEGRVRRFVQELGNSARCGQCCTTE